MPLTAYVLEKREFPRSTWSRVDKISPDLTSYCVQNLTTGSDYFFRVMAENKAGPSPPLEMDKPVKIKSPFGCLLYTSDAVNTQSLVWKVFMRYIIFFHSFLHASFSEVFLLHS